MKFASQRDLCVCVCVCVCVSIGLDFVSFLKQEQALHMFLNVLSKRGWNGTI